MERSSPISKETRGLEAIRIEVFCSEFCGNGCTPPMPYAILDDLSKIPDAVDYHINDRHEHCIVTVVVSYP